MRISDWSSDVCSSDLLEESIRALAVESIDEMAAQGSSCDFAESVALRYPLRVILSLMGLPREDEDMMLRLTQEVFNPQDPDMSKTRSDVDESEASSYDLGALADFNQFLDRKSVVEGKSVSVRVKLGC